MTMKKYKLTENGASIRGRLSYNRYQLRSGCDENEIRSNTHLPAALKNRILNMRPGTKIRLHKVSRGAYLYIEVKVAPLTSGKKAAQRRVLNQKIREMNAIQEEINRLRISLGETSNYY